MELDRAPDVGEDGAAVAVALEHLEAEPAIADGAEERTDDLLRGLDARHDRDRRPLGRRRMEEDPVQVVARVWPASPASLATRYAVGVVGQSLLKLAGRERPGGA